MATFSTWASLESQLLNDLASRDLSVQSHRSPDGRQIVYRTADEIQSILALVRAASAAESTTAGVPTRRTTAVPTSDRW